MSVIKQVAIHNFVAAAGLPREMAHEILSFCFYDTITSAYRASHKKNMKKIMNQINSAEVRVNVYDEREHWFIGIRYRKDETIDDEDYQEEDDCRKEHDYDEEEDYQEEEDEFDYEDELEINFQAITCGFCGNYRNCYMFPPETWIEREERDDANWQRLCLEAIPNAIRCCCRQN